MPSLTKGQILQFNKEGFLIVDLELDEELMDSAKDDASVHYGEVPSGGRFQPGARAQDAWKTSDSIRNIALNTHALGFLKQLFGRKALPFQTLNFPVGTQQKLHSDTIHFNSAPSGYMAGVWVALEDVDKENGPLIYYPGSHKFPEFSMQDFGLETGYSNYKFYETAMEKKIKESGIEPAYGLMKKGQALIWHANLVHGGSKRLDSKSTRHSQVTHYYFEGCRYYTPMESTENDIAWRQPVWIKNRPGLLADKVKRIAHLARLKLTGMLRALG